MKLFYAPQSPFARKVRAAAIELGLGDRIALEYTEVVPGQPNGSFGRLHNPLRKIPALLTVDGATIYDSTVICEYLDDLAGGGTTITREASRRWRVLVARGPTMGITLSRDSLTDGAVLGVKAPIRDLARRAIWENVSVVVCKWSG
jgi:glutathione S-transferase